MDTAFNFDEFRAPPPSRFLRFQWWLRKYFHQRPNQRTIDRFFKATNMPYVEENLPEIHAEIFSMLYRLEPGINDIRAAVVTTLITRLMALETEVRALKEQKNPHGFLQ